MKRRYLVPSEIKALYTQCTDTRYPARNRLVLQLMYRHGLRASELCGLLISDVDFGTGRLSVQRLKDGMPSLHPLQSDTMRLLKAYMKEREVHECSGMDYLILSERGPMTRWALTYLFNQLGQAAKIPFKVFPHMARHSCGYTLSNSNKDIRLIQDYMGHKSIASTVRYTAVNAERFKGLWR